MMSDGQGNLHGVVTFEQGLEAGDRNHGILWRRIIQGRENSLCNGPGAESCLQRLKVRKPLWPE